MPESLSFLQGLLGGGGTTLLGAADLHLKRLRGQLIRLQCAVLASQGAPLRDDCSAAPKG